MIPDAIHAFGMLELEIGMPIFIENNSYKDNYGITYLIKYFIKLTNKFAIMQPAFFKEEPIPFTR